ncbi:hypothetical protein GCM10009785_13600 [Brooklawnia cerclae]|uniref:Secreted protein n=1 Tax=Brooklawnia cerclae TaxID=349934 RepID=A0ABX0SL55_9ACTN|nr:hypothetical protein [Brooklawnia cerclae]NIH58726.1 hypothetical protein [Brooklawnia cerclae]
MPQQHLSDQPRSLGPDQLGFEPDQPYEPAQPHPPLRSPRPIRTRASKPIVGIGIATLGLLIGTNVGTSPGESPTPTSTIHVVIEFGAPTPEPTTAQPTVVLERTTPTGIGSGMWEVGVDIQPGQYTAEAEEDDIAECFWARLSSSSQFIAGDASRGRLYATVRPDDAYFLTTGCTPWVPT